MRLSASKYHDEYFPLGNSRDLDPLMQRVGNARLVLLGEASHGTHEYYTWRTAITKRLIQEKDFQFIAVEGDWPDCYKVNRYIKGFDDQDKTPEEILHCFNRWPTWMWANWEIVALITWLKEENKKRNPLNRIGFYGLDVYSLWESMESLITYLKKTDKEAAKIAEQAFNCFAATGHNEHLYARHALSESCREQVVHLLTEISRKAYSYNHDTEAALNTTQNAHVAVDAEKYYRNMISFEDETWNIRDTHMMETLNRLLTFYGNNSRAIIWEHNTHIGDARYTDMHRQGMINVGELARKEYGESATVLVGFGSYLGKVMAGRGWGAPMEEMDVPPAKEGSIEYILHERELKNQLIIFDRENKEKQEFEKAIPHRAIGVVYHPYREYGNYVPTIINKRYDAFIFLDETQALHPLHIKSDRQQVPETYPFEF